MPSGRALSQLTSQCIELSTNVYNVNVPQMTLKRCENFHQLFCFMLDMMMIGIFGPTSNTGRDQAKLGGAKQFGKTLDNSTPSIQYVYR